MTINSTARDPARAVRRPRPRSRASPRDRISGTTQNDILKEYIARGTWIYPPRPSMRLVTDIFEFCVEGAAALEHDLDLAATTCARPERRPPRSSRSRWPTRSPTARRPSPAGLAIDDFAPRLLVLLRRLVGAVRGGRQVPGGPADVGPDRPRPVRRRRASGRWPAGSTSRPPARRLTAQSIDNNVVRTTVQALSAVLGGAQSLHTNARDEALALPTEESARLALRTQQILAHESGVTETPDPLAGSYFVESADDAARGAPPRTTSTRSTRWAGRSRAIEGGFQQRQIQESAYRVQAAIERGDLVVVGVNQYRDDGAAARPAAAPADRPGGGAAPDRAGPARPGGARRGRMGGGAAAARGRRPRRGEPAAAADRGGRGLRDGRRDQRPAAGGLGRAPRADHGLITSRTGPASDGATGRRRPPRGPRGRPPRPRTAARPGRRPGSPRAAAPSVSATVRCGITSEIAPAYGGCSGKRAAARSISAVNGELGGGSR